MKHLSWLVGHIFYIVTSSWLDGPKWLKVWLYQNYLNSAVIISLVGLIFHPSLLWLGAFFIAVVLTISIITRADAQVSIKRLTEAYNDILDGDNFILKPLAADTFLSSVIQESSSIEIYKNLQNTAVKTNPFYHNLFKNPLRVFIVKGKDKKILSNPKAYTNFLGQSLVFLDRDIEKIDVIHRFLVLHELEHINLDGARQLSRIYSRPIFMFFSAILLCLIAISWWHWLLIIVYVLLNLNAHIQAKIKREVIADNAALIKLSNSEEQQEVVEFFIEKYTDDIQERTNLEAESINILTWEEHPFQIQFEEQQQRIQLLNELRTQGQLTHSTSELIDRLRHLRWYEYRLKKGKSLPYLGWTSFWDNITPVPFNLFFLYLGIITTDPPLLPFVLMIIFIVVDVFLFVKYMTRLQNISSNIDNNLAAYNP
ncbi:MAG: hypothetical protein AAF383_00245 [Cyanobacteria bacterium P01_A01_bin.83]